MAALAPVLAAVAVVLGGLTTLAPPASTPASPPSPLTTAAAPRAARPATGPTGPAGPAGPTEPQARAGAASTQAPAAERLLAHGADPAGERERERERESADPADPTWTWPLPAPVRVLRGFDPPAQRWLPGHRGVDLTAAPGEPVRAAGAGVVTFAGPLAGRGVVTVTHGELRTTYEPVTALVRVGQHVDAGEPLGTLASGASHCGGLPSCLHWGLRRGEVYLDPLSLLGVAHPVLLPIPHGRS